MCLVLWMVDKRASGGGEEALGHAPLAPALGELGAGVVGDQGAHHLPHHGAPALPHQLLVQSH